jgi:hypothetical protein
MFLLSLLLAAATPAIQANAPQDNKEPFCIYEEIEQQIGAGGKGDVPQAIATCTKRYGWSKADADMAMMVTKALVEALKARTDAKDAGVDLDLVDKVIDGMSASDTAAFGWEGDPKELPTEIFRATIIKLKTPGITEDRFTKASLLVLYTAQATNAMDAFMKQRKGRSR